MKIVSPANGATVSGTVLIATQVQSPPVVWENIYIDGKYFKSSPPLTFSWDSTTVPNGTHTIRADGRDNSGVVGTASITVTVKNGISPTPTPTSRPTTTATRTPTPGPTPISTGAVTISSPANGATVAGAVSITVKIGVGVSWINAYIDENYFTSSPPLTFGWDSRKSLNGRHTISARAYSSTGTLLGTASVTVNVQNPIAAPTPTPTAAPTASVSAVKITSPLNGATASGTVSIVTQVQSPPVTWENIYIDGNYLVSSPPYTFSWNSSNVVNGSHTIRADGWSSSGVVGTASVTVTTENGTAPTATPKATASATPTPRYFSTAAPHAALPSGAQCASLIAQSSWEPRPENQDRAYSNIPTAADLASFHSQPVFSGSTPVSDFATVDGNYTGTTDMMIRWAACKWGMDEDAMRAQAVNESQWYQAGEGDWVTTESLCHGGAWNGWTGSGCDQSYGIYQVKVYNFNAWPTAHNSISFNVDLHGAYQRACMNGDISYLSGAVDSANGLAYPNNNTLEMFWGCIGQWYSGGWYDSGARTSISHIKSYLASKPWLHWPDAPTNNVGIVSPLSGTNLFGTISVMGSSSDVSWFDIYIDGGYRSSVNFKWDTTSQTEDGIHDIAIDGFDSAGNVIGHNYIIVNVRN